MGCSADAKILRANMESAGRITPSFKNSAHHIILSNSRDVRMRWLRRKMNRLGIDINDAENGIFLPTSNKIKLASETIMPAHSKIHTEVYKQEIFDRLKNVTTKGTFIDALEDIYIEISRNAFPF